LQQLAQRALWRDEGRETATGHSIDCHYGLAASRPRHGASGDQRPCRRRRGLTNTNGACIKDISHHFSAKKRASSSRNNSAGIRLGWWCVRIASVTQGRRTSSMWHDRKRALLSSRQCIRCSIPDCLSTAANGSDSGQMLIVLWCRLRLSRRSAGPMNAARFTTHPCDNRMNVILKHSYQNTARVLSSTHGSIRGDWPITSIVAFAVIGQ
jgi:hypothetical protein